MKKFGSWTTIQSILADCGNGIYRAIVMLVSIQNIQEKERWKTMTILEMYRDYRKLQKTDNRMIEIITVLQDIYLNMTPAQRKQAIKEFGEIKIKKY